MVAGADSIDDMALLRHGAMSKLFTGMRTPSTLGTFLRSFSFGHVRQLDAVASRLLINLAGQAPLLPGADELAYVDVDDTLRPTYGYAEQGAGRGYTGVKGLNALLAVLSTPSSAPVIITLYLKEINFRNQRALQERTAYALNIIAAMRGGLEPDILEDMYWWHTRDIVEYAIIAATAYVRACAQRRQQPSSSSSMIFRQRSNDNRSSRR